MKRDDQTETAVAERSPRAKLVLYTIAAFISLAGLADATYLTVKHLTGAILVCGGSLDCSKVLGSAYASIGPLPTAGLGALAYFAAFSCATLAAFGYPRAQTFLTLLVSGMFVATLWLLYLQAFVLHAFCRYCLFSAALTFILAAIVILCIPPRS